jgi:hypothetical protein
LVEDAGKNTENAGFKINHGTKNSSKTYIPLKYLVTNISDNSRPFNLPEASLYKFDTGGYTGAWGPEGRLAMLHQKEIVLNAHDTENLLIAVGIVRDISD